MSCLSVSGYHFVVGTLLKPKLHKWMGNIAGNDKVNGETYWLPLMVHTREELVGRSIGDCFALVKSSLQNEKDSAAIVQKIQADAELRRLTSLAMRPSEVSSGGGRDNLRKQDPLYRTLVEAWPQLLQVPTPIPGSAKFDISVIVPCFRESATDVDTKLGLAFEAADNPQQIELILVNAGQCSPDLNAVVRQRHSTLWGRLVVLEFPEGRGRGPCLNHGAQAAQGQILTFLHADTRLPEHWDARLQRTLTPRSRSSSTGGDDGDKKNGTQTIANACAFGFGIDTSPKGLNGKPYPPGILAVETTANLRCKFWSLPYGDQCLSLPAHIFHYLGGFPDQCIMEDYELVSLLRRRAALGKFFGLHESLRIIPGSPALCSPRRWQSFGVLYVTWMNSFLVNLYAGGTVLPAEIYRRYYGQNAVKSSTLSQ